MEAIEREREREREGVTNICVVKEGADKKAVNRDGSSAVHYLAPHSPTTHLLKSKTYGSYSISFCWMD